LSPELVEQLNAMISNTQIYKSGEHIFHANEKMRYIFAVYEGACKDYWVDYDGNEMINEFYFTGDIIGLDYAHNRSALFSTVALKKTTLCAIALDDLFELAHHHKDLQTRVINLLCQKIYNSNQFHLTTSAKKRVAAFYVNYISRMQEREHHDTIPLYVSQIDISNKLGLANETFNRILHGFMENGWLSIHRSTIESFDLKALETMNSSAP
jgi:CRP/FNR family transcriptional regulator